MTDSHKLSGPDYQGAVRRQREKNQEEVLRHLERKGPKHDNLIQKIRTFAWDYGFSEEDVKERIRMDGEGMFRATFAVNPRKQGIDRKTAHQWLKNQPDVQNVEELSLVGQNVLYVSSDGSIRQGGSPRPTKPLSFRWKTGRTTFYAMHKRTIGEGGAQGKAMPEVRAVLENFQECNTKGIALMVILDGDFWNEDRITEMRHLTRESPPKSFALPMREVPAVLMGYQ